MTTLVTGINGFAGNHLADHLIEVGEAIAGTTFGSQCAILPDSVGCHEIDLGQRQAVEDLITKLRPQKIYHLAGYAAVGSSFNNPPAVYAINFTGTLHLLEAVRRADIDCRVVIVSSGDVYGRVDEKNLPVKENHPLRPDSPYSASKASMEVMAQSYRRLSAGKMEILIARPFNHIGPRQATGFVCPDFATQIAAASDGDIIRVGNLSARRDFTDVRDIVRGYRAIMEKGTDGEVYNLASGTVISIEQLLENLIRISGKNIRSEKDPARYRAIDVPVFYGDASKAQKQLGWRPQIDLQKTLEECYEYYKRL